MIKKLVSPSIIRVASYVSAPRRRTEDAAKIGATEHCSDNFPIKNFRSRPSCE
jgi:hypothetical protein